MKRLIVSLSIFAFIIVICVVEFMVVNIGTNSIISQIDDLEEVFMSDDVDSVKEKESLLIKEWENHEKLIELFASHMALVDIDRSFAVMCKCIESDDKDNFLVESASARSGLEQLQDEVVCDIHNIF